MSRFLTLCLLIIPFAHGLSVLTDTHTEASHTDHHTDREFEEEIYENITKCSKQSAFIPPVTPNDDGEHGPVHVKVNGYVRDIFEIKKIDNDVYDWTADLIIRQKWNDKRLAYDVSHHPDYKNIVLNSAGLKKIWHPDTFFSHSVKGDFHFLLAPNTYAWVYPNGDVLYSIRVTVTFRCVDHEHHDHEHHDDHTHEPHDDHTNEHHDDHTHEPEHHDDHTHEPAGKKLELDCPVRIASYGFTDDKIVYEWDHEKETPLDISKRLYLPHFSLTNVTTETNVGVTRVGGFSSLIAKFHFLHK